MPPAHPARPRNRVLAAFLVLVAACGGRTSTGGGDPATEAEWRELRTPRPEALPGAVRITVSDVTFAGSYPWPGDARVEPGLGVSELVAAGLLRRRDVRFVERRRFAAAVAAERRGDALPAGRPPAGVSPSADMALAATWIPAGPGEAFVEVRLTRLETGDVEGTTRTVISRAAGPVELARSVVAGALDVLSGLDRLPEWDDPLASPAPGGANAEAGGRVSTVALRHFLRGLAAEEAWRWEDARRGYQRALADDPGFHEARAALARTARLRLGGTLAES